MFEQGLGGLAVVDFRNQSAPRTNCRLENNWIAQFLYRSDRRFWCERHACTRCGDACGDQRLGGFELVTANIRDLVGVDGRYTHIVEYSQGVERAGVMDTALKHDIIRVMALA